VSNAKRRAPDARNHVWSAWLASTDKFLASQQIVTFRARFTEILPTKLQNLGPQDIERGVVDSTPSPQVEHLLCALLGLVLNRKKPVEYVPHTPSADFPCSMDGGRLVEYKDSIADRFVVHRRGHHGRALEEAVLSQKPQWPLKWNGANPLHGGKSFENMTPQERVRLSICCYSIVTPTNIISSLTSCAP
jgi:hypothetical protein